MKKSIFEILTENQKNEILSLYKEKQSIRVVSKILNLPYGWVRKILLSSNCTLRHKKEYPVKITEENIREILNLYINQKRGIQYISETLKLEWDLIKGILLKNNISFWTSSEHAAFNRQHYGATKGFSGRKHKNSSKKQISKSLIGNANRSVTGSKSQFILTAIGKVQGSYEVAYLQSLLKKRIDLPEIGVKVQTPYGLYFPDFQFKDRFIEVKSKFTWDVCNGIEPNPKGVKTDIQRKKIDWTSENIKPVEVVILETKQALDLFREAINNEQLVIEKVIYKNGKYYKIDPIPVL